VKVVQGRTDSADCLFSVSYSLATLIHIFLSSFVVMFHVFTQRASREKMFPDCIKKWLETNKSPRLNMSGWSDDSSHGVLSEDRFVKLNTWKLFPEKTKYLLMAVIRRQVRGIA
jgi:hypothetical protein